MIRAKLPVGIIGLGRLGYRHATTLLTKVGLIDLIAAAEPFDPIRKNFSNEYGIKTYKDYHDLLDNSKIKAVIIVTPTSTHVNIAKDAINKGMYVFCEKPTSDTLSGAKELSDFVREKDAFLQVGFMMRFYSGHVAAKQKIEKGEIGEPVYFQSCGRDSGVPKLEFIKKSGGLIFDMMIHDLDLVRWYLQSEPIKVYAQGSILMHEYLKGYDIDEAVVILEFKNNKMAVLEVSRNCKYGYDARHEIIGTQGAVIVGPLRNKPYSLFKSVSKIDEKDKWSKKEEELADYIKIEECVPMSSLRYQDAYIDEFTYFATCALTDKKPNLTAFDSYMAIKICTAANESLKEDRPIYLSE